MKSKTLLFASLLSLSQLIGQDDVYYSPENNYSSERINRIYSEEPNNENNQNTPQNNNYNNNNNKAYQYDSPEFSDFNNNQQFNASDYYYDFDNDYFYSSRLRRFNSRRYHGFGYYNDIFTNVYYYNYDPFNYGWNINVSFNNPWWGYSWYPRRTVVNYINPYNYYYDFNYGYYNNFFTPTYFYSSGWNNPWMNPWNNWYVHQPWSHPNFSTCWGFNSGFSHWGADPYWNNYWNGYYTGYYHGIHNNNNHHWGFNNSNHIYSPNRGGGNWGNNVNRSTTNNIGGRKTRDIVDRNGNITTRERVIDNRDNLQPYKNNPNNRQERSLSQPNRVDQTQPNVNPNVPVDRGDNIRRDRSYSPSNRFDQAQPNVNPNTPAQIDNNRRSRDYSQPNRIEQTQPNNNAPQQIERRQRQQTNFDNNPVQTSPYQPSPNSNAPQQIERRDRLQPAPNNEPIQSSPYQRSPNNYAPQQIERRERTQPNSNPDFQQVQPSYNPQRIERRERSQPNYELQQPQNTPRQRFDGNRSNAPSPSFQPAQPMPRNNNGGGGRGFDGGGRPRR